MTTRSNEYPAGWSNEHDRADLPAEISLEDEAWPLCASTMEVLESMRHRYEDDDMAFEGRPPTPNPPSAFSVEDYRSILRSESSCSDEATAEYMLGVHLTSHTKHRTPLAPENIRLQRASDFYEEPTTTSFSPHNLFVPQYYSPSLSSSVTTAPSSPASPEFHDPHKWPYSEITASIEPLRTKRRFGSLRTAKRLPRRNSPPWEVHALIQVRESDVIDPPVESIKERKRLLSAKQSAELESPIIPETLNVPGLVIRKLDGKPSQQFVHYRGASFEVLNPHASLLYGTRSFETPAAEIDGLLDDYFHLEIPQNEMDSSTSTSAVSDGDPPTRQLYDDPEQARRRIMRLPTVPTLPEQENQAFTTHVADTVDAILEGYDHTIYPSNPRHMSTESSDTDWLDFVTGAQEASPGLPHHAALAVAIAQGAEIPSRRRRIDVGVTQAQPPRLHVTSTTTSEQPVPAIFQTPYIARASVSSTTAQSGSPPLYGSRYELPGSSGSQLSIAAPSEESDPYPGPSNLTPYPPHPSYPYPIRAEIQPSTSIELDAIPAPLHVGNGYDMPTSERTYGDTNRLLQISPYAAQGSTTQVPEDQHTEDFEETQINSTHGSIHSGENPDEGASAGSYDTIILDPFTAQGYERREEIDADADADWVTEVAASGRDRFSFASGQTVQMVDDYIDFEAAYTQHLAEQGREQAQQDRQPLIRADIRAGKCRVPCDGIQEEVQKRDPYTRPPTPLSLQGAYSVISLAGPSIDSVEARPATSASIRRHDMVSAQSQHTASSSYTRPSTETSRARQGVARAQRDLRHPDPAEVEEASRMMIDMIRRKRQLIQASSEHIPLHSASLAGQRNVINRVESELERLRRADPNTFQAAIEMYNRHHGPAAQEELERVWPRNNRRVNTTPASNISFEEMVNKVHQMESLGDVTARRDRGGRTAGLQYSPTADTFATHHADRTESKTELLPQRVATPEKYSTTRTLQGQRDRPRRPEPPTMASMRSQTGLRDLHLTSTPTSNIAGTAPPEDLSLRPEAPPYPRALVQAHPRRPHVEEIELRALNRSGRVVADEPTLHAINANGINRDLLQRNLWNPIALFMIWKGRYDARVRRETNGLVREVSRDTKIEALLWASLECFTLVAVCAIIATFVIVGRLAH